MTESRRLKLLIVDDSPTARQRIVEFLSARDYKILQAGSGATALRRADIHQPDIILLDAYMPEMDGIECLRRIRENSRTEAIRILMMAGENGFDIKKAALNLGCSGFVSRPLQEQELLSRIDKVEQFIQIAHSARQAKKATARITLPPRKTPS